ncbi:MAG: protein-export chaperone SecB [Roseiflexaceae bacterium]
MPAKKRNRRTPTVKMSPPELWRFEFIRDAANDDQTDLEELSFSFGLGLSRPSLERLAVEFSIEIKGTLTIQISVVYRAIFEIDMPDAKPEELEQELRFVAANLAPTALYPFARETVATTVAKSGLPPLIPPIINFRTLFDPKTVEFPAVMPIDEAVV